MTRAAVALLAVLGLAAAPAVAVANTGTLRYVNMGDSYSAGAGIVPPAPGAPPACAQSSLNWGHDLAAARGYQLTDVSCSGAETKDYTTSQYPGVAPQLNALSSTTRLVTMTIGGNDNGVFVGTIQKCGTAAARTAGQGSPCKDMYGNSFVDTINNSTYPNLVATLTKVRAKAPHARVAISGYLQILPPTTGCYPIMPIASGDVPYLDNIQATLNSAVKRAAARTGVTFIDVSTISAGHDACKPVGTRWVEPILGSTNFVPVHPNALGEKAMAGQAGTVLGLD
ncbi:SGNH/GDSL hydrolase family protein [Actinomycetospora endophytica]|uniref:SGNH/GDSL hydrolase family protein n=1 Tax=Actinomycetospora endophytica TaxID=2291215 RepID=A0ABS8P113_9PSEU|nr:SGNH/GDSL hydrolase family protein [Actinomycetospora endophytica]MCD2191952.1 SGNH/GDSL hydrolase family protein [Actinomycetospora endophytica]